MEDKTGIFTALRDNAKETEDRTAEDALASIFGKKTANPDYDLEKTTILEQNTIIAAAADNIGAVKIDEENETAPPEEEDDGQPFYIENTALKQAKKKRRKEQIREQHIRRLKANQSRKTFAYLFGGILLVVFIVSIASYLSYFIMRAALDFSGITTSEFEVEVEIPEDATTEEIAGILAGKELISNPGLFTLYSQLFGFDGGYLSGLFILDSSMSYSTLVSTLQSSIAARETVIVTIPEGLTAEEIGRLLEENFVCLAADFEFYYKNKQNIYNFERRVQTSSLKFYQLEGYLFPDTYEFFVIEALKDSKNEDSMTEKEKNTARNAAGIAANKMLGRFNEVITNEMYKSMNEKGFTLEELITLASMVQAEAATMEDMQLVASVFINRLNNSGVYPRLESDPTRYYVRDFIAPHITTRNSSLYQAVMDAYDTYQSEGLPPGPINNPGIDAITAVLEAPRSSYFFFNANIETKQVYYAETPAQHAINLEIAENEMVNIG